MSAALAASSSLALKGASLRAPVRARKATVARAAVKTVAETPNARVNKFNKSDIMVSPSILSADFANLGADVRLVHPHHHSLALDALPSAPGGHQITCHHLHGI
jgi:ribulose-phosphate 3-epimerase